VNGSGPRSPRHDDAVVFSAGQLSREPPRSLIEVRRRRNAGSKCIVDALRRGAPAALAYRRRACRLRASQSWNDHPRDSGKSFWTSAGRERRWPHARQRKIRRRLNARSGPRLPFCLSPPPPPPPPQIRRSRHDGNEQRLLRPSALRRQLATYSAACGFAALKAAASGRIVKVWRPSASGK